VYFEVDLCFPVGGFDHRFFPSPWKSRKPPNAVKEDSEVFNFGYQKGMDTDKQQNHHAAKKSDQTDAQSRSHI
jgi:hypothetical protein